MGSGQSLPEVQFSSDKVAIVTGGNTGLGYETAKWIASRGATVVIACRSEERAQKAILKMQEEFKYDKQEGKVGIAQQDSLCVEFMKCDNSSFKSVKEFATAFIASGKPLHMLVCNAGLSMVQYSKTEDGYESMFQVNHLSHFLLVGKLLPLMLKSGDDGRIVNVTSKAYEGAKFESGEIQYTGPEFSTAARVRFYGKSKLYTIMVSKCMARRLKDRHITVINADPGFVATDAVRHFKDACLLRCIICCCGCLRTSPFDGAKTQIKLATDPALKGRSGEVWAKCKEITATRDARDETKQEELWKISMDILKDHLSVEEINCLEGK